MKHRIKLGWIVVWFLLLSGVTGLLLVGRAQAQAVGKQHPSRSAREDTEEILAFAGTTFTYQGSLKDGGSPANGTYDFRFKLFNAASGGAQVGSTVTVGDVTVSKGLFTAQLDFGDVFDGTALWLAISVRPGTSTGSFTNLSPRQALTAAPYASFALKVADHDHWGETWIGPDFGLTLKANASYANSAGLISSAISQGTGVQGLAAEPNTSAGMLVPTGVSGISLLPAGGFADLTYGVYGQASGNNAYGVYGYATYNGTAGVADGVSGMGVYGEALGSGGTGVYGTGPNGLYGLSTVTSGNGVVGVANPGSLAFGVWGLSGEGYAGYFSGKVNVTGTLTKGGGAFKIDHPLDPANKYLYHSFVESPDMKNIYDGVAELDENGEARISLPDWFEALNRDFRYQLTCIGGYAPVYIKQEIQDGTFVIAGGSPGLRVSWQVTGIRQDPWANENRIPVEEQKPAQEVGTYLYPQVYGQPESLAADYARIQQILEIQENYAPETNAPSGHGVWIDTADGDANQP